MKTFFVQPLITEKSMAMTTNGTYQFVVPTWVTKPALARYIAERFNVTVISVATARMRGNDVRFRNRPGNQSAYKKATITLKKGDAIAQFSMPAEAENATPITPAKEKTTKPVKTESTITVRSKSKKTAQGEGA